SRPRRAQWSKAQDPSHTSRAIVSLPEYGPIPAAPGIHSFPTSCTQVLKGLDAAVNTFTTARASIPSIAARSAATAAPLGSTVASRDQATSTGRSTSSIRFGLEFGLMVSLLSSRRAQLRHGCAKAESHQQVEERQPHQYRDRVTKPRSAQNLRTVPPEDERGHHRERQREERPELLELEEDLMDRRGVLDEVRTWALGERGAIVDVQPVPQDDGDQRRGGSHHRQELEIRERTDPAREEPPPQVQADGPDEQEEERGQTVKRRRDCTGMLT